MLTAQCTIVNARIPAAAFISCVCASAQPRFADVWKCRHQDKSGTSRSPEICPVATSEAAHPSVVLSHVSMTVNRFGSISIILNKLLCFISFRAVMVMAARNAWGAP